MVVDKSGKLAEQRVLQKLEGRPSRRPSIF